MKTTLLRLLTATFLSIFSLHAADESQQFAVNAADDKRVSAMKSTLPEALNAIFADDLHYAHSNGVVDTKSSFIEILTAGHAKYIAYDYLERECTFPVPDIALMTGRVKIKAVTATGETDNILGFLPVWPKENGQRRFFTWQSC